MPWIVKQSPKCPGYKPWGVFNQQTGAKEGCHPSKEAATQQQKALYAKEPQMNSADDCECNQDERAQVFKMPDGSYPIERCTGDNSVESAAKLAHHSKTYSFDQVKAHVMKAKNALGCPDSVLPDTWKSGGANSAERPGELFRDMPFQLVPHSDGLTLEGYAAVFNSPTRIGGWEGDFEEQIAPGAFARTLRERMPVLMFEHGRHPLIGSMPLGILQRAQEDTKGVYVEARLSDNWLIQPVRDAVRDGAVTGMSFRFSVPDGGDTWMERKDSLPLRTLTDVDVRELGPVVFPAYEPTTAYVRSALDRLPNITGRPDTRSAGGGVLGRLPRTSETTPALKSALQARDRELRILGVIS